MTRRRKDRHLPPCVYLSHGAYYMVKRNVWTPLGRTLPEALATYARHIAQADADQTTVSALLDRALAAAAQRVKPTTLKQYQAAAEHLRAALAAFHITEVRPTTVAQLLDHWAPKPAMANRMRTVLKLAFDAAVRAGQVDSNPVTCIAPLVTKARTRYLTDTEYRAIWEAANPALRSIMDLAYLTGQRIDDVLSIREADINATGIDIDQQKTGKRLTLAWTSDLRAAIDTARALHSNRKLILLGLRNGKKRSYTGVRDLWDNACKRAGVADAHLHDLRAKAITDAKRQGLNPQDLAGHTTEAQTVRYLRGRERDVVHGPSLRQLHEVLGETDDKKLNGKR